MISQYSFELLSWWALFGAAMGLTFIHDNSDSSDEDDDTPFDGLSDFEAGSFGALEVGTMSGDVLAAEDDTATAIAGLGGDDTLTGSRDSDYILGNAGNDEILGRVGIDTIRAGDGNDYVNAGLGTDFVYGGSGDDTLDGGGHNDRLYGEDGDDLLIGGFGPDYLEGGAGNDTLSGLAEDRAAPHNESWAEQDGSDTLSGGAGHDVLWLGAGDIGAGGEGADSFVADQRGDFGNGTTIIADYNATEDEIALLFDPPADGEDLPEVTQAVSDDGQDRLIMAGGIEIARIIGAGSGDPLDIAITTEISEE